MSEISAKLVKELRERTGAGMMECKKALMACGGDIEKAVDELRKAGAAKADKKAGRIAAEGLVAIVVAENGKSASVIEINCETDFVARDQNFVGFVGKVVRKALESGKTAITELSSLLAEGSQSVEDLRKELVTKLGENISLRRSEHFKSDHHIGSYVHSGRIAAMVELQGGSDELAKDIAMHIAAENPMVISGEEVPAEMLEREKEIFIAQATESGKPMDIVEKMVQGRMRKYLEEVSLTGQAFVKDPNMTVGELLKKNNAKVLKFVRYEVGEGIEKEESDFVAEVMAQAGLK